MYAEARKLENGPSSIAEATLLRMGIEYYLNNHLTPLMIETNSLILKKVLDGVWEVLGTHQWR